jgi:hypothetical protein
MGGFSRVVSMAVKKKVVAPRIQKAAVKAAPSGPTIAEMQQDGRAVGRRGRRATILTSSQGIDEDITLGYKTLLG